MYVVAVQFNIKPEYVEEFDQAVRIQADNSLKNEEGCHQFDVNRDPEDKTKYFLYEVYTDAGSFEYHRSTGYFANFAEKVKDWVADKTLNCFEKIHPE